MRRSPLDTDDGQAHNANMTHNTNITPSGIYDYTTGEMLDIDDCPPEGQGLTGWIMCPAAAEDEPVLVDLRTVPNDLLEALYVEAGEAGDERLVESISQLLA